MSAPGLKITNFHYSKVTFPQGEFQEYPKWIHMAGYKSVIVDTKEEEEILRARPLVVDKVTAPVVTEVVKALSEMPPANFHPSPQPHDERMALIKSAEGHKVKIDRRWSTLRIRQELETAKK